MSESVEVFDEDERKKLSVWAVNELIADAEAKRLLNDKSLAEVISACIRFTEARILRDLKFLLEQRELEGRANFVQGPEKQNPAQQGEMDALQSEILKLLAEHGQMHWGTIRNKLNGQPAGWDVSDSDVHGALYFLLKAGKVNRDNRDGDRWTLAKERYSN